MPKIHKMLSLDRETYNIAQKIPNFSAHVRHLLTSDLVCLDDCSNARLIGVVLYRMQKQYGFESDEAQYLLKVLQDVRQFGTKSGEVIDANESKPDRSQEPTGTASPN